MPDQNALFAITPRLLNDKHQAPMAIKTLKKKRFTLDQMHCLVEGIEKHGLK
jgi:hypothetical protein